MDMSSTIAPKSDQLNADDLIGGPRTITITRVSANPGGNGADQPVNVFFEGDANKPFRPCKSMRRVMVAIWGKDAQGYAGRSMTIYRDPEVTWGGMKVGGIRISHMTDMDAPVVLALTATQKQRKPYRVEPLKMAAKAETPPAETREAILTEAQAEARKGKATFVKWWQSNKARRDVIRDDLPALQSLVDAAEAEQVDEDDPFGLPPINDPTPEDRARAESEAMEYARSQGEAP